MNDELKQPREYDLVLGGNNPPPTDGLVLGGIEGLKLQFNNTISEDKKISILKQALNYGEAGEAWLFDLIATEKNKIQWLAAVLLSNTKNEVYKELLLEYFAEFIPNNIEKWNEYIQNHPNLSINLQGINSEGYIYLGRTLLRNINFGEANLKLAIFELSNLIQVDFSNSNLSQANFNQTIHDCVKFDNAIFSGNYYGFQYTSFKNVSFTNNNLTNIDFSTSKFEESTFDTCQLHNSHFDRSEFNRTIFRNSEAENIDFRFADLKGVKFDRVNLKGADFR